MASEQLTHPIRSRPIFIPTRRRSMFQPRQVHDRRIARLALQGTKNVQEEEEGREDNFQYMDVQYSYPQQMISPQSHRWHNLSIDGSSPSEEPMIIVRSDSLNLEL